MVLYVVKSPTSLIFLLAVVYQPLHLIFLNLSWQARAVFKVSFFGRCFPILPCASLFTLGVFEFNRQMTLYYCEKVESLEPAAPYTFKSLSRWCDVIYLTVLMAPHEIKHTYSGRNNRWFQKRIDKWWQKCSGVVLQCGSTYPLSHLTPLSPM